MTQDVPNSVTVVIPVRDRAGDLSRCLASVIEQVAPFSWNVVVCDDGSSREESRAMAACCRSYQHVRFVRQRGRGPAAARNRGVRATDADIVVFLDSDTIVADGWLQAIVAPFADSRVVAVEGAVQPLGPVPGPLHESPRNSGGACLTANMAYRRHILARVGGLDERYPLAAFEDTELALRVRAWGRIAFAPDAVVLHPWRRLDWKSSIRRIGQFDWLLVTALRHGCLGWAERPTRIPRLRIALAAGVTLPLGRFRKGAAWLTRAPLEACSRMGLSLVEAVVGLYLIPHWLRGDFTVPRLDYLKVAVPVAAANRSVTPC